MLHCLAVYWRLALNLKYLLMAVKKYIYWAKRFRANWFQVYFCHDEKSNFLIVSYFSYQRMQLTKCKSFFFFFFALSVTFVLLIDTNYPIKTMETVQRRTHYQSVAPHGLKEPWLVMLTSVKNVNLDTISPDVNKKPEYVCNYSLLPPLLWMGSVVVDLITFFNNDGTFFVR